MKSDDTPALQLIDLEQPRSREMPIFDAHRPGYDYYLFRRHSDGLKHLPGTIPRTSSSGLITMMEHSGTHVDALCHQAEDLEFYGCTSVSETEDSRGFRTGDASELPIFNHPGVLLDVVPEFGGESVPPGTLITAEHLERCALRQNSSIEPGTVVLVRTGNGRHWFDPDVYLAGPGISPSASQWLRDRSVFAVGADNVAWDLPGYVDDSINCDLPGHLILLVQAGIYIFENLALESLAAQNVHSFHFFATPLKLVGATGSPIRPVAIP
ncbi:cyclase family protein [Brevibacterium luteolum]|uniref:Cyclase n=1 Tax=Brevibacterium luteolum TaxID=199591 RepID=A0A2N6PE54_9MICO|nr:cyclase family protein [Brevibacterium luteolum]PMB96974.1 cyclase [Brevibacterium luteolum]